MTTTYDLVVIGGGSGGLAAAKEAVAAGASVAVLDRVTPSTQGTTWGLGGTCVNVGCIPKKLMHQAALFGHSFRDATDYGWEQPTPPAHRWDALTSNIRAYIKTLNFGHSMQLREKKVKYINAHGRFLSPNTIECVYFQKSAPNVIDKVEQINAKFVLIAVGGRPHIPDIPGALEHSITSDDVFFRSTPPGKTLVVGASYVALECAGFINGLGFDTTVMVRSILLRGFDQQMAEKIGGHMASVGIKFIRGAVPTSIEKLPSGKLAVQFEANETIKVEEFDTVLFATGRSPCTRNLNLEAAGVEIAPSGHILVGEDEETNIPNIFAIGDVIKYRNPHIRALELTPVAIKGGRLLARRLFANSTERLNIQDVPTTVFTPLEYACVGMSEEQAVEQLKGNLEVYHSTFRPLEWALPKHPTNICYCKLLCDKSDQERVVGIHYFGPNAGEVVQGYAVAVKCRIPKAMFDTVMGIHPTCAEELLSLTTTKSSGKDPVKTSC